MALVPKPIVEDGTAGHWRGPGWPERAADVPGRYARPCIRPPDGRAGVPSGWAYTLHYGTTDPNPPQTLPDGTIRRYDNAHEDTKGHELHAAPDPEPAEIEFPGMAILWKRFWAEIPKDEFDIT